MYVRTRLQQATIYSYTETDATSRADGSQVIPSYKDVSLQRPAQLWINRAGTDWYDGKAV
ncbi:MAG TPA: hypothetical protein VFU50_21580 [Terriglobales bacterium]|nr:hypothetical protein [Terriglobales bacterium]